MSDLEQLIEMGFDKERSELAVKQSGGLQGALEWLEQNQDKSLEEIEEESKASNTGVPPITDDAARSLVCDDCGKQFRNATEAEFHASKTQHENFSQSTEEIAPLTEEEKQAKLEALREKLAAKRAGQSEQDKIDQKRNEEIRRKSTKESQDIKEELARKEQLKEAAKKRAEKQADIDAKKRVQARIAADKEERRLRAEKEKAEREGRAPVLQSATAAASISSGQSTSKAASEYTETRIRFQTPEGNIMKVFPVGTTLFEVASDLSQELGREVHAFLQTFPKKVFDQEYFGESLKDLKLVPSASLIVQ